MDGVELSVVIAAHNASAVISTCLAALEKQCQTPRMEVIVADSSTDDTAEKVAREFPWVHLLHFDGALTVPELRGRGIAIASGDIIAILDPFSIAASDWAERVLSAHKSQVSMVIGGTVSLYHEESCSWQAWAVYFNEYGLFMPPVRRGSTWIVPGSNVSYKRTALFDGVRARYPVFWKTFVNQELARSGPLWQANDVNVVLNKPIPFREFLRTRFHHGRCFGAMRMSGASAVPRALRAMSSPLLPLVLVWRWTRGFWPKRRRRLIFALTLPAQLLLFSVWAWGEGCAYLRGRGRSCEQLFY